MHRRNMFSSLSPSPALRAVVRRETHTTRHNRYVQVFALLLVVGSLTIIGGSGTAASVAFGLLLLLLYVVPLFAVLVGVSSAHESLEERPVLLSHPLPRGTFVAGKLATLVAAQTGVLTLALVPAAWRVASVQPLLVLWGLGGVLISVWTSTGLVLGIYTSNRPRGLVAGLCVWFASLVLYDLGAFALAGVEAVQSWPAFWVSLLLLNPSDAVRLAGLTLLDGASFTAAGAHSTVTTLLAWTPIWVVVLAVAWSGAALGVAWRRLEHHGL